MSQYACPDCGKVKDNKGLCESCEHRANIEVEVAAQKGRGLGKRWR